MSRSDCGNFLHISTIFPVINKCEKLFSTNHQITFLIKREDIFTDDLPSQKSCLIICISYCLIFRFLYNWNIVTPFGTHTHNTQQQKLQIEQIQRRAARYVSNRYHNTSSVTDMMSHLNWAPLEMRLGRETKSGRANRGGGFFFRRTQNAAFCCILDIKSV